MSAVSVPLFIDTGAFFAHFNERAAEHDRARSIFEGIREGTVAYGPLFTSRYVLVEFATLMQRKAGHSPAVTALETIRRASSVNILPVGTDAFNRVWEQVARYDDQRISFVDHSSGVLAVDYDIEHIFSFDPDDFRPLGFTVVPDDTGEA